MVGAGPVAPMSPLTPVLPVGPVGPWGSTKSSATPVSEGVAVTAAVGARGYIPHRDGWGGSGQPSRPGDALDALGASRSSRPGDTLDAFRSSRPGRPGKTGQPLGAGGADFSGRAGWSHWSLLPHRTGAAALSLRTLWAGFTL